MHAYLCLQKAYYFILITNTVTRTGIFRVRNSVCCQTHDAKTGEAGACGRTRQPPQRQHSSNNSDSIGADDEVPSLDKIDSAIKQLKSNKSAGIDGLAAELFKMVPERLTVEIHRLIIKVWEQEELSEEWKLIVIHPVYKRTPRTF